MIGMGFIILSWMICKILILALVLIATVNTQNCESIVNCVRCDVPDVCDECETAYFIDDNQKCTSCGSLDAKCQTCSDSNLH